MKYFNYHAKVKKLILSGKLTGYRFVDNYNGICPALVLYFDNHRPMPIRSYRWEEYVPYLMMLSDKIKEEDLDEKILINIKETDKKE